MDEELWSKVKGSGMYISGAVEGHVMSAPRKECENKDGIPNLHPRALFTEGMRDKKLFKRRFPGFVLFLLLWLFWKIFVNVIQKLRGWGFSSPFNQDVQRTALRSEDGEITTGRSSPEPSLHRGLGWLCTVLHQVCAFSLGKGIFLLLLLPVSQWFHGYGTIKTVFSGGFSKSLFSWKLFRDASERRAMGHPHNQ